MAEDFLGAWEAFRAAREDTLTAPHGFLAITGMFWLAAAPQRFDRVPGAWSVGPNGVEVDLGPDESMTIDGREISGYHVLGTVDDAGIRARAGDLVVEVASRGAEVILRPRDPAHPRRAGHKETPTYPPSADWVRPATFHPLDGDQPIADAIGEVAFEVEGRSVRLVAYDDEGDLWLVFSDATSGRTTYSAGRQLYAPGPASDGTVVLDFNRTINLPCAYTDFTTCPVPLPQNRLTVPIEAGEQLPLTEVKPPTDSRCGML